MATTESSSENIEETIDLDLPDDRHYADPANKELDEALVDALQKAEKANNDYLKSLLQNELKSLYYKEGTDF